MKYTFTVEIEDYKKGSSFVDEVISEINEDRRQMEITNTINKETSKKHKEMLTDIVSSLNKDLSKVGLSFIDPEFSRLETNEYRVPYSILWLGKTAFVLAIHGHADKDFIDSKYSTYTGNYTMMQNTVYNASSPYLGGATRDGSSVKDVECLIEVLKRPLKDYLRKKI